MQNLVRGTNRVLVRGDLVERRHEVKGGGNRPFARRVHGLVNARDEHLAEAADVVELPIVKGDLNAAKLSLRWPQEDSSAAKSIVGSDKPRDTDAEWRPPL